MVNWTLKNRQIKNIKSLPEGATGFVYILHLDNGKKYIGRKNLYSITRRNFGKKELSKITDKRLKTYEVVKKESNWLKYNGSNKTLLDELSESQIIKREIIKISFSDKELTYLETQALFCYGAIESDEYYNDNILGKFYRRDLNN